MTGALAPSSPIAPDLRAPAAGRDGLRYLLALSLLLHLALLAWPVAGSGDGHVGKGDEMRAARLTLALAAPSATRPAHAVQAMRHAATGRAPAPRSAPAARGASPTAAAPEATPEASPLADLPRETVPTLALPAPTRFYPADQLTARPHALGEPLLDPQSLDAFVASGEVALTLWIDENGRVADVLVESSDLPAVFAQTATAAFRELRFAPGEIDGQAVGSVLRIAVRYDDERLAVGGGDAARAATDPAT